jgi:type I restriction enzyme S subunit
LEEQYRPIKLADDKEYDLVTVKRSRGGVVPRERLLGKNISVKSQFRLNVGDFLISKRQIVHGACGIVPASLDGTIVSNEYAILTARPTIDLKFLNYLAHSIYFQQTCFHSSIGVHVEKMIFKLDRWLKWKFNLPPLHEQQRIAEILSTWDQAIEKVEVLIANAKSQKKALMQSLLTGKVRLPGFSGEWTKTAIANMGTIVAGGTPDSTDANCWGGNIAWATPTDVTKLQTRHISRTERYITSLGLSSSSTKSIPVGTVIVCTRATVGALAIATVPMTTNQGFKNIVPHNNQNSDFLYFLISQNKQALLRAAAGSTFAEVSKTDFEKLSFYIPTIGEQRAIADVLICAETAIEKLENKLSALRAEKSALMQQLLTGKRRVKLHQKEAA